MEPLDKTFEENISYEIDELSSETPVGWSSICLDQTISYYIEHNPIYSHDNNNIIPSTQDLL